MDPQRWQQLKPLFHAALDLPLAERDAYLSQACADDDLRKQVAALLESHEESGAFLVSPAEVRRSSDGENGEMPLPAGQRIGPYKIVREIGHGGMGRVFLAVRADDQYQKQVAIKLIKRGMDTDLILRRFMMERQILANLEHPNIARLLEGGSTADGLPYFVMEYIEGRPITDYCEAKQLTTHERLELFREVCSALQYAHQNLVVHRDIKPSNIMVTPEGVAKLLDFGIAKLLSPGWNDETGATSRVVRLMTPEYASPEQLRGVSITTVSDVYSLGVVLYELLSGRHPYRLVSRQPDEVAEVVIRDEPEKPSAAVSRANTEGKSRTTTPIARNPKTLQGDLDNIVLKAMRKEPERRYASAQEFSEDIRRHLEGLPVTASPDTLGYRTRKFVQRHRTGAIAAAVMFATIVTATVVTAWQARVARRERARAEQRFNDVRKLANSVVFEIHDSIQDLPGSTPSRVLLVTRALEYLDKLAGESAHDPSLQLELAAAYDKIGDIQGGWGTSNVGERKKAYESYRKSLAIRETLVAQEPNNVDFRRTLATSYTKLGGILWTELDINGALELYDKALALNKTLAAQLATDLQARIDLSKAYQNVGYMHGASGRADVAIDNMQRAVALMEELAASHVNDPKVLAELAAAYDNLAIMLYDLKGNHAEALTIYRKSQKIGDSLLATDPANTKLQRGQAVGDYNVGLVSLAIGDTSLALDNARRSFASFQRMSDADPQNAELRQGSANAEQLVGEVLIKTGEAEKALPLLTHAYGIVEKAFAASPTDQIVHFRVATVGADLGHAHVALATNEKTPAAQRAVHWREARNWFQKSREILQVFRDQGLLTGNDSAKLDGVNDGLAKSDVALGRLVTRRTRV